MVNSTAYTCMPTRSGLKGGKWLWSQSGTVTCEMNTLSLLFKQLAVTQLNSRLYLVNMNQMSFVALANWHAYCVINYELMCRTLCTLCTMLLCFCV